MLLYRLSLLISVIFKLEEFFINQLLLRWMLIYHLKVGQAIVLVIYIITTIVFIFPNVYLLIRSTCCEHHSELLIDFTYCVNAASSYTLSALQLCSAL